MDQQVLIDKTVAFVQQQLKDAEGGHDWWHTDRVWKLAKRIGKQEDADMLVVELAALLHDIGDHKFHDGDEDIGANIASDFLESQNVPKKIIVHVKNIIRNISFKGGNVTADFHSKELEVVQDADRLDAMGAIGIARTFNYGGFKNRKIYDPAYPPQQGMDKDTYMKSTSPTLNHFYEKLLLLKDRMNTATGKAMAVKRHAYMEAYLEQFHQEWHGDL